MSASVRGFLRAIHSSPNPVFATDNTNHIIGWNRAMERLLGYRASQVVGSACYELIAGKDIFGNIFCDSACGVQKMIRRNQVVKRFDMAVKHVSGHMIGVHCSILVVPGPTVSRFSTLHLLEKADDRAQRAGPLDGSAGPERTPSTQAANTSRVRLTPRERQVLHLLATGAETGEIASSLSISATTVKTHVRNLFLKIGAHSRLEVVMRALQDRLL